MLRRRVAFIAKFNPAERSAGVLAQLHKTAALATLGYHPTLVLPRVVGTSPARMRDLLAIALVDAGIDEPLELITVPRPVWTSRWQRLYALLAATIVLCKRADLVWTRDVRTADFTTRFGIRTILENHHPLKPELAAITRRMMRRREFLGFVAISGVHRDLLISGSSLPADKIVVGHSAVAKNAFISFSASAIDARRELDLWGPLAVYSGSFLPGKGPETILDAARSKPRIHFVCVGGEESAAKALRSHARDMSLCNLTVIDRVPQLQLRRYLEAADVLLLPYTREMQGIDGTTIGAIASPLKLFEYCAAGRPIVASALAPVQEILRHGHSAWLVDPGNSDALADAVELLVHSPALSARLAASARNTCEAFTWEARTRRVLNAVGFSSDGTSNLERVAATL
jgi:glycosyltransferase involved in cell wall biosynthesis